MWYPNQHMPPAKKKVFSHHVATILEYLVCFLPCQIKAEEFYGNEKNQPQGICSEQGCRYGRSIFAIHLFLSHFLSPFVATFNPSFFILTFYLRYRWYNLYSVIRSNPVGLSLWFSCTSTQNNAGILQNLTFLHITLPLFVIYLILHSFRLMHECLAKCGIFGNCRLQLEQIFKAYLIL